MNEYNIQEVVLVVVDDEEVLAVWRGERDRRGEREERGRREGGEGM